MSMTKQFQSTRPRRGATRRERASLRCCWVFQPTRSESARCASLNKSTMSPTFQSTRLKKTRLQTECAYCWRSRHSSDAARHDLVSIHTTCMASILRSASFNPRARRGARCSSSSRQQASSEFQSTRSNASKGTIDVEIEQKYCVSIHAVYCGTTHSRIYGAIPCSSTHPARDATTGCSVPDQDARFNSRASREA